MGDDNKGNSDGTRGGGGLVLRGGGGLTTYAEVRGAEALALRTGWHGEEMPTGMSLGRLPTETEPGRYVWRDPAGGAIEMVYVPQGDFPRMLESLARRGETWNYEAITAGFYASVYPCMVGEFRRFVQGTGYDAGAGWVSPVWPLSERQPVTHVSRHDAQAYCSWIGLRLLTAGEWEYAARGADGREYPWGDEAPDASRVDWARPWGDGPQEVGLHPLGVSPLGLHNLSGSVWEWTESTYSPGDETRRVLRGGCWDDYVPSWVRASRRYWFVPTNRDDRFGFRCALGMTTDPR